MANIDWKKYDRQISYIIWALYVILLCFVSYHHEPWHDEGQAWLIARDDSIWQMITVTLHWEGHPPLWHLLLMPFAKMGVPFELGLKSVNIACCSFAMWLLLIKSPLPWYFRYFLLFNYFFFYQYGVINRCYSLLMAGMMLCAYYYPSRREKPYHLALSLALVAGTQAYGMMLACGIALAWLIEILRRDYKQAEGIIGLYKQSAESRGLLLLFVISLFFVYCMKPNKETAFAAGGINPNFLENILYMISVSPGALLFSNDFKDAASLKAVDIFIANFRNNYDMIALTGWPGALLFLQMLISYSYGFIIHGAFIYCAYKMKKLLLYILPMGLYSILAGMVFWGIYHAGVLLSFFVFIIWQLDLDKESLQLLKEQFLAGFSSAKIGRLAYGGLLVCLFIAWGNNIYWSFTAAANERKYVFDPSKEIAEFIKENRLDQNRIIWTSWHYDETKQGETVRVGNFNINAYFPKNVLKNVNDGQEHPAYHRYAIQDRKTFDTSMRRLGPPDFIIMDGPVYDIFPQAEVYIPVHRVHGCKIWKTAAPRSTTLIYMREELKNVYRHFQELEPEKEEARGNILIQHRRKVGNAVVQ